MNVAAVLFQLLNSEDRIETASRLARVIGGKNLLLFVRDPTLGVPLPATGFPQTLPSGRQWLDFLKALKPLVISHSVLPSPYDGETTQVSAVCDGTGVILAVLGGSPSPDIMQQMVEVLPLAGLSLQREQQVRIEHARVQEMSGEITSARQLAGALNTVRRELELALEKASEGTALARQASQDLLKANEELAVARDQALAANRAKSAFLANMSHELRTPLTAVIGYSEMLQDEITKPESLKDLKRIQDAGQHLLVLVNDILDMARIEAGKAVITIERFDVSEVMGEAAAVTLPQAVSHGNSLTVESAVDLPPMHSDRVKLRQVLVNILSNAAKFTRNGTITISARYCPEERRMNISVQDTGIGIAPEELHNIFKEFAQVENRAQPKMPGTGLGLSISRRLCRLLGGDIYLESCLGHGSVFTVKVPTEIPPDMLQDAST